MSQNIILIPYTEVDGIRNCPDSLFVSLFKEMETEGTFERVFFSVKNFSASTLLNIAKDPSNVAYFCADEKQIGALVWLTNFEGRSAQAHFIFLKPFRGFRAVKIGHSILHQLIFLKDAHGQYALDVLIGITPTSNTRACRFVQAIGMQSVGVVPNYLWDDYKKESVPGMITFCTREIFPVKVR